MIHFCLLTAFFLFFVLVSIALSFNDGKEKKKKIEFEKVNQEKQKWIDLVLRRIKCAYRRSLKSERKWKDCFNDFERRKKKERKTAFFFFFFFFIGLFQNNIFWIIIWARLTFSFSAFVFICLFAFALQLKEKREREEEEEEEEKRLNGFFMWSKSFVFKADYSLS